MHIHTHIYIYIHTRTHTNSHAPTVRCPRYVWLPPKAEAPLPLLLVLHGSRPWLVLAGFQQPSGYATVSMLGYSRTLGVDDLSSLDFNSDVERESHLILRTQQANGLGLLEPVCRSWAASFNHASKHIEIMIQPQACWKGNGISNKWNSIRQDLAYTA